MDNSTILIINDAADALELMSLQLHQAGYQILTATDGREGVDIALHQRPDMVISDVAMPKVNGIELCRMIRAADGLRTIPILIVSGIHKDDAMVVQGLKAGADDYLEVPYNQSRLVAKVERLLERRRAEGALNFQAHLLNTVEQAVIATDLDGKISYLNKFAEKLYGWSATEAIGGNAIDLISAQTAHKQASEIMSHLKGGRNWTGELLMRRKDGTTFFAIVTHSPLYNDQGAPVGIVGVSIDITERKRAEETLRENEARYRTLFDSIDEGFCTIEVLFDGNNNPIDYRFLEVNPSFKKQTGIKDALGRRMLEIAPQHEAHWVEIYGKIALTGEPARFESAATQLHRWYDVYAFRIGEPQERKVAVLFNDITERKRAEKLLRRANDKLERRVQQRTHELMTANALLKQEITERMRVEQTLREKHDLLQGVTEGTTDCIFAKDLNGRYLMVNSASASFIGKSAEEIVGRDDTELFPPEIAQQLIEHDHQVYTSERAESFDEILVDNGMPRTALVTKSVYRDDKGEAIGLIGIARDITGRKLAEDKIKESERQLALAQQIAHLGSWEWDISTNKVSWSDELYRIAGLAPQQFAASYVGYLEQVHPDDREFVKRIIEISLRTHKLFDFEHRIIRQEGAIRTLRCRVEVVTDDSGHAIKMHGIAEDITDRKLAEEARRNAEEKYQRIFENAVEGIFQYTPEGRFISVNPAMARMYCYDSCEEMINDRTDIKRQHYVNPERCAELERLLAEQGGIVQGFESEVYRKDRSRFWTSESVRAVRDQKGTLLYYQGFVKDITERVRAKEARMQLQLRLLAAQEEERSRLSRELHDQMGQHLPALTLGLKALKDADQLTVDSLQQLQDLAERIARDTHTLAKDLRPAALDDFGLITALSDYLEEWSERHGILPDFQSIGFNNNERFSTLIETTLYRTVQEALTNIAKHAKAEHVSLILEEGPEVVLAVIEDDGKGFDVEAVMGTPIRERRLGLLGMQERVELVGGTLEIESAPGAGTTVAIRIPILTS